MLKCKHNYCTRCYSESFKTQIGIGGPYCPEQHCGYIPKAEEVYAVIENHIDPELQTMVETMIKLEE